MELVYNLLLEFLHLCIFVPSVEALRCYFCVDNGINDKCGNYSTYLEARMTGPHSPFLRNCSSQNNNICYIETYRNAVGTTVSEIRDCSDGSSFSFSTSEHQKKYRKLNELTVSNKTRCVYDGQNLVCLSKCVTDFCNGPQIDNSLIASSGTESYPLKNLNIVLWTFLTLLQL